MELEKIRELLKKSKTSGSNSEYRDLAESFEQFVELYQQRESYREDSSFRKRLGEAYKKFWGFFERVLMKTGFTVATLKDHCGRSENFSPQQWQTMQSLKQQKADERQGAVSSVRRFKKTKNQLRV